MTTGSDPGFDPRAGLGVRPLTPRSLALSALLGTHPPTLPARALVALGDAFGFAEGAMRTALSRLVAGGDAHAANGRYTLGPRLLERQASQDAARTPAPVAWDGAWWIVIVHADRRPVAERRAFRARMRHHRLGELRPDLWLRPANVAAPPGDDSAFVTRSTILDRDPAEVARQLWDLEAIAAIGRGLEPEVARAEARLAAGDPAVLPDTFMVSVAVARFLLAEPQLPEEVSDVDTRADVLRAGYERLERLHAAAIAEVTRRYHDR